MKNAESGSRALGFLGQPFCNLPSAFYIPSRSLWGGFRVALGGFAVALGSH